MSTITNHVIWRETFFEEQIWLKITSIIIVFVFIFVK